MIRSKRSVGLFWGGMDAFYILFVVFSSFSRGVVPFVADFKSALVNMEQWGGGLEFVVWMGLAVQISLVVSCLLLCLDKVSGVCLAVIQMPFRVFFVVPSFSLLLLLPDTSTWVWLSLIAASEGAKAWSLWWLWRRRG